MALIFLGQSVCPICGQILKEGEDVIGIGPASDKDSELYPYFDCGYHLDCFTNWEKKDEITRILHEEKEAFHRTDYFRSMLKKHGPPDYIQDQFVQVIDSYKFSDGKLIVFLKWDHGKLADGIILDDLSGRTWIIKYYVRITGSFETYEKIERQEEQNIFQYLLDGGTVSEKPEINAFLKIISAS